MLSRYDLDWQSCPLLPLSLKPHPLKLIPSPCQKGSPSLTHSPWYNPYTARAQSCLSESSASSQRWHFIFICHHAKMPEHSNFQYQPTHSLLLSHSVSHLRFSPSLWNGGIRKGNPHRKGGKQKGYRGGK